MNSNKRRASESKVTIGSGNVFADLGLSNPEVRLLKAQLTYQISTLITAAGLTQSQAAKKLGVDQPKISALLRGRLAGFSIERLLRFLNQLGQDVEITIRPSKRKIPAIHVSARKIA
jgi:predicted XRE-type DNA-binding protein